MHVKKRAAVRPCIFRLLSSLSLTPHRRLTTEHAAEDKGLSWRTVAVPVERAQYAYSLEPATASRQRHDMSTLPPCVLTPTTTVFWRPKAAAASVHEDCQCFTAQTNGLLAFLGWLICMPAVRAANQRASPSGVASHYAGALDPYPEHEATDKRQVATQKQDAIDEMRRRWRKSC
ncbi:hypothetical protein BU23DRAFT_574470 [Bimuria novae-zelandiae CBS 107.79]|uniref:Uncharacterized protein n=1 Tax=Bimuria novae-zelandiae CBS 107.79 TaxID=1447943 RepID=A0A6A5UQE2_9PLEO|nr:hypothetical protein BU23DRAFT_574470 [Bimuria novae-zelandiae CBS 107.79]